MADDDDFAAMFEQSVKTDKRSGGARKLRTGELVEGIVVAIAEDTVFVDVGTKAEARIDRQELVDAKGQLKVKVGDKIRATVAHPGGRDAPQLVVSMRGGGVDLAQLELARESGLPIEGEVTKAVKAGLEVMVGSVRAFCPASLVDLGHSGDLEVWVGQRHFFRVLEVKDGGRSVVLSRKALLLAEREQQANEAAKHVVAGAELDGIVQAIQPYGAFVDLGGIGGLIHVSELAHGRVSSPQDVVAVGEKVRVRVLSVEPAASGKARDIRISLSMKALVQPDAEPSTEADELLTATVVKVESYGLLVETPKGPGLVPTAEIGLPPGGDPRRAYAPGTTLEVVLLRREPGGKLRLSARKVGEAEARRNFRDFKTAESGKPGTLGSLGELLEGKLKAKPARKKR